MTAPEVSPRTGPGGEKLAVDNRPTCIIDLPSHVGTLATWRSRSHPTMTVCDRHADQYAEAYDDDTRIEDWEPIWRNWGSGTKDGTT